MTLMTFDAKSFEAARPLLFAPAFSTPATAIRDERARDFAAREKLLDEACGPNRRRKTSERLREGRICARGLSLIASNDGEIVGTVRLWHVDAGGVAALLLGPLAVAESERGVGLGARLMGEALFRAASLGHKAVLLVGDAPYYARFGFSRAPTRGLALPGPVDVERFLALEFEPGALDGAKGMVVATGEVAAAGLKAA